MPPEQDEATATVYVQKIFSGSWAAGTLKQGEWTDTHTNRHIDLSTK